MLSGLIYDLSPPLRGVEWVVSVSSYLKYIKGLMGLFRKIIKSPAYLYREFNSSSLFISVIKIHLKTDDCRDKRILLKTAVSYSFENILGRN